MLNLSRLVLGVWKEVNDEFESVFPTHQLNRLSEYCGYVAMSTNFRRDHYWDFHFRGSDPSPDYLDPIWRKLTT